MSARSHHLRSVDSPVQGRDRKGAAWSVSPARSHRRRREAETKPSAASPSWAAPRRGMVTASIPAGRKRRYSTPRLLLGVSRRAACSGPSRRSAAARRHWAKDCFGPSSWRRAWENSGLLRHWASAFSGWTSPHSLPKERMSTTPAASRMAIAPLAKPSAEAAAHTVGSSSTRSTPPARAIPVRVHLSVMAHSPRWTQLPLITDTMAVSSEKSRRVSAMCQACPVWKGLYSATIPIVFKGGPPGKKYLDEM